MVSGRKLGEDSSSKNDWRAQALLCRGAFFIPRVRALPGRESRMPAEVAAIRPAVAGTRGMNRVREEKIVAPARDRQGEAYA